MATVAACGRTPLGDPLEGFIPGDDDDDDAATTPTVTLTPTPTPEPCTCSPVTGANTGLVTGDIPEGQFAANAGQGLFICHDALGFYAMSDLCTHAALHIITQAGSSFNETNLAAGFRCGHQNSIFNANGARTGGPAPAGSFLTHYLLSVEAGTNALWLNQTVIVDPTCRCTAA